MFLERLDVKIDNMLDIGTGVLSIASALMGWGNDQERMNLMHRFFINEKIIDGDMVKISGDDFNHISYSLRLNPGDNIILTDIDKNEYIVKLQDFSSDYVKGKIVERKRNNTEAELKITIAQAIPKKRNMDLVIQKNTELGVYAFIPLETERTVVKLNKKKEDSRIERWQKIAREAAKQSERGIIPEVQGLFSLKDLIQIKNNYDFIIVLWEDEDKNNFSDFLSNNKIDDKLNILLIIGPEGGFSTSEIEYIKEKLDGYSISLGSRILRTETAGIIGSTILLYESGNMGG